MNNEQKTDLCCKLMGITGSTAAIVLIIGIALNNNIEIVNIGACIFGVSVLFTFLSLWFGASNYYGWGNK